MDVLYTNSNLEVAMDASVIFNASIIASVIRNGQKYNDHVLITYNNDHQALAGVVGRQFDSSQRLLSWSHFQA